MMNSVAREIGQGSWADEGTGRDHDGEPQRQRDGERAEREEQRAPPPQLHQQAVETREERVEEGLAAERPRRRVAAEQDHRITRPALEQHDREQEDRDADRLHPPLVGRRREAVEDRDREDERDEGGRVDAGESAQPERSRVDIRSCRPREHEARQHEEEGDAVRSVGERTCDRQRRKIGHVVRENSECRPPAQSRQRVEARHALEQWIRA